MEDWIILTKFFTLVYIGVKFSTGDMNNADYVILIALLCVCIDMLFYIFKNGSIKTACLIILILIFFVTSICLNPLFIILIPIHLIELIYRYTENKWVPIIFLSALLLFEDRSLIPEYILASFLSFMIYSLSFKHFSKMEVMNNELDDLRQSVFTLNEKLLKDSEYEKQVKYSSQLEERNKIAQEIHDRIGHSISGSLMQLEAIKMLIGNDSEKSLAMVQNVIDILREGMESIRSTLRNIKPSPEQLGINRVKLLIDEFSLNSRIRSNLVYKGNIDLITHLQWKAIYESIKESLTNAAKYSKATIINVNIEVLNKLIKTEFCDNGIGAINIKKGIGISGIIERTENLGGKVILDGTKGFSIILLLPVREE